MIIYLAAVLPYRICFNIPWSLSFAIIDFFMDLFFLGDIVLNFFTSFMHDGELVGSYSAIAQHYLRSWFLADLVATIPFDWFIFGITFEDPAKGDDGDLQQLLLVVKSVRLLRLLRVARVYRYISRWEEHFAFFNSNVLRLLNVITLMAFFSHWNGCFQYLLATFEAETIYDPVHNNRTIIFHADSWVARLQADGVMSDENAWSWAYFIAICQMLAISVGLKQPKRQIELWGYLASILMGACLYGFFVASLTTAISEADASAKDYRTKLDMVNQYMRHSQLPKPLRAKLRTYFELCFPSKRSFDAPGTRLVSLPRPRRCHLTAARARRLRGGRPHHSRGGGVGGDVLRLLGLRRGHQER